MENVEFPISWSQDDEADEKAAAEHYAETAAKAPWEGPTPIPVGVNRIPEHWDGDRYTGPVDGTDEADHARAVPFEDQNFAPGNFIILSRIYDLLAVIALSLEPVEAEAVLNHHEAGNLIGSEPFLQFGDDDEQE